MLGYPITDRQKLPDCHVPALWLVDRVVSDCLDFRNMIPGGNKRSFIKLKDVVQRVGQPMGRYLVRSGWASCPREFGYFRSR